MGEKTWEQSAALSPRFNTQKKLPLLKMLEDQPHRDYDRPLASAAAKQQLPPPPPPPPHHHHPQHQRIPPREPGPSAHPAAQALGGLPLRLGHGPGIFRFTV